jgi:hypothetical protein
MTRSRLCSTILATALAALALTANAGADTAPTTSASTTSGYQVSLTGPASAVVGQPATYSATCGGGYACPSGEFRAFGSVINRLGEGFGRGATGSTTFRAPGTYSIRYRVGQSCPGSPRRSCPIDVWITTAVTAS